MRCVSFRKGPLQSTVSGSASQSARVESKSAVVTATWSTFTTPRRPKKADAECAMWLSPLQSFSSRAVRSINLLSKWYAMSRADGCSKISIGDSGIPVIVRSSCASFIACERSKALRHLPQNCVRRHTHTDIFQWAGRNFEPKT